MTTLLLDESGPQVVVAGADRVRFLNGMVMGNVATLAPGGFLKTASLNPKGRLLAIFDVIARPDDLVLIGPADRAEALRALLDRHVIADDVAVSIATLAVHRWWGAPAQVWDAAPVLGAPPEPAADPAAIELRRIEAGLPRFGADVSEDNFPFETPLARLIDYKKGCYVGQEPVARVAARGSAAKQLRGLEISGETPVPIGAVIATAARASAGQVDLDGLVAARGAIALGFLPRTDWDAGTHVVVDGRDATVVELPFGG